MIDDKLLSNVRLVLFDFDGVFTDNGVYISEDGSESVRCWRSDGLGLARLHVAEVTTRIISTEKNPVVAARAAKLNVPCRQGVTDKAEATLLACDELQVDPQLTMYVGNDINDIPAFGVVGMPVGVADAHPATHPYIIHQTQKAGGYGAVREICDLIYNAKIASS